MHKHSQTPVLEDLTVHKADAQRINTYLGADIVPLVVEKYSIQMTPYDGQLLNFLPDSRALFYDSHKFLFLLLFIEARKKGKPLGIIHIDRHWDNKCTQLAIYRASQQFDCVDEVYGFVNNILHEGDFLTAACAAGFVEEVVFVVPCDRPDTVAKNLSVFAGVAKVSHQQDVSFIESLTDTSDLILDIDVDYFLDVNGQLAVPQGSFARLFAKKWQAIGVALSPRHLGGIDEACHFLNIELPFEIPKI